jgi:hypothetical protein
MPSRISTIKYSLREALDQISMQLADQGEPANLESAKEWLREHLADPDWPGPRPYSFKRLRHQFPFAPSVFAPLQVDQDLIEEETEHA